LNRLLEQREQFFHLQADTVMTKNPKIVTSGTLASEALGKMEQYRVVALPVVNGDRKLIGVVHLHDILQMGIRN
jgi:arabinose-5-phosphate isomerase